MRKEPQQAEGQVKKFTGKVFKGATGWGFGGARRRFMVEVFLVLIGRNRCEKVLEGARGFILSPQPTKRGDANFTNWPESRPGMNPVRLMPQPNIEPRRNTDEH